MPDVSRKSARNTAASAIGCGRTVAEKPILYIGHENGSIPVSNGLSDAIAKELKAYGFKYLGTVTVYSHLQACGIINDHGKDCPCYHAINLHNPTVRKRRYLEK